jgi:hypothetical protein
MKINICFYTNEKYRYIESNLIEDLTTKGFDKVFNYKSEDVKKGDFYRENKELLELERGDGYWLWKPKIILESMDKMEYGDVIFYMDAGDSVSDEIVNLSKEYFKNNDYYFTNWGDTRKPQIQHTKRDCFILMNCDEEKYHNTRQIEAGFIAFKKTKEMIDLLNEYLFFCKNKYIVSDYESVFGPEYNQWKLHRHDQSILTNLIIKNNLSFSDVFFGHVGHNIHPPL